METLGLIFLVIEIGGYMLLRYIGSNEKLKPILGESVHNCYICSSNDLILVSIHDSVFGKYIYPYTSITDILKDWEEVEVGVRVK